MLKLIAFRLTGFATMLSLLSCEKFLEIKDPKDSLTTQKVFNNDKQATAAMIGVFSQMINKETLYSVELNQSAKKSADEMNLIQAPNDNYYRNDLTINDYTSGIWQTAYEAIYGCNAVLEGISESTSLALTDPIRRQLTAEAIFTRAFSYFYLINIYGDVPLILTSNLVKNQNKARTPVAEIYEQIIKDLTAAIPDLPAEYPLLNGQVSRIRPSRWAAKALLARVFLYTKQYPQAIAEAGDILAKNDIFALEENDINAVFLKNSKETIWQLQPDPSDNTWGNKLKDADLPNPLHTGPSNDLSSNLLNAFEPGDIRRKNWIDSTRFSAQNKEVTARFIYKYKIGMHNKTVGMDGPEYHMVIRLAEIYLIRAEAYIMNNELEKGIADLNSIRKRAQIPPLQTNLTQEKAIAAVAKERQTELFGEWGHRWLDLKRTGRAEAVLSAIPAKQPWRGSYQLLYPLPLEELKRTPALRQNPGY